MCRKAWNGRRRDMEWIDTSKLHQFRCVANPYLRHLEAQGCSARSVQQRSLSSLLPKALISASGSVRGAASWTAYRLLSSHRCPWMRRLRWTRQWQKTRMQKSRQQGGMLHNGRQLAHGDASSLSRDSELIHVSACRKDARGPEGSFLSGATIWMEQQIKEAPCR